MSAKFAVHYLHNRLMKLFDSNFVHDDADKLLWQDLLGGNIIAFEALIERTYDLLFQYGTKFCRDHELIKDSIQDIFMEIWEKKNQLNTSIPPKAYLLASLRRRLHRLSQRNRLMHVEDFGQMTPDFTVEFSVEYQFIQDEQYHATASQITSLLNHLPKRQQEAIYLKFFHDLDRDEIAAIMDIHPQSVSNLLQTAFKWLRLKWKTVLSIFLFLQLV
jgi:RNA polymerase sigma factor (sigma-70 family)